jgi:chromosome segregation ATPase
MAEAAYHTIKNLNERIDEKNSQLQRKDELMKQARETFVTQRNKDAERLATLEKNLSVAQGSKLSHLHSIASNSRAEGRGEHGGAYDGLSRKELANRLADNTKEMAGFGEQIEASRQKEMEAQRRATNCQEELRRLREEHERALFGAQQAASHAAVEKANAEIRTKDVKIKKLTAAVKSFEDKLFELKNTIDNKEELVKTTKLGGNKEYEALKTQLENEIRQHKTAKAQLRAVSGELDDMKLAAMQKEASAKEEGNYKDNMNKLLNEARAQIDKERYEKERAK